MRMMNSSSDPSDFSATSKQRNVATEAAVRLLTNDPSFWDAIRPSWLVDSEWRPRIGAFALWSPPETGAEPHPVLITRSVAQPAGNAQGARTYGVVKRAGGEATAPIAELSAYPYVPWAVIRRHAIPKLATAGLDAKAVDWDAVCDVLHQHDDPAHANGPDAQNDDETNEAASAPRI